MAAPRTVEGAGEGALEGPGGEAVVGEGVEGIGDGIAFGDGEGEGTTGRGRGQTVVVAVGANYAMLAEFHFIGENGQKYGFENRLNFKVTCVST
ncbi:hypothetical protein L1987_09782 [Smallanthus sonchifolius]|uniref:Uncharacterized protein n=1 Tax=Smallanthus sonchifolius TaxID=185202 RepID=A0ACB9JQG3_9ASTR|nr:hypothetical protein L1987_09782 [Smallanthus sonchifolius]